MRSLQSKAGWLRFSSAISKKNRAEGDLHGPLYVTVPFLAIRYLGDATTKRGRFDQAARLYRTAMRWKLFNAELKPLAPSGQKVAARGPDFVIIGGAKCGTTSLFAYMNAHPKLLSPVRKEIRFFNDVGRGLAWYLSHFPPLPEDDRGFLSGEASTSYFGDFGAPARLHEHFPGAKLIALLRNPVERAISHYHDDRARSDETRSLEDAMNHELEFLEGLSDPRDGASEYWNGGQRGYLWSGLYVYFLERWREIFPEEQLLILRSEDFYTNPAATMRRVFEFVGVSDHPLPRYDVYLQGQYPAAAESVHSRLAAFFRPHNRRLEDYLGRKLHWG